jgi:hypothetical protein
MPHRSHVQAKIERRKRTTEGLVMAAAANSTRIGEEGTKKKRTRKRKRLMRKKMGTMKMMKTRTRTEVWLVAANGKRYVAIPSTRRVYPQR